MATIKQRKVYNENLFERKYLGQIQEGDLINDGFSDILVLGFKMYEPVDSFIKIFKIFTKDRNIEIQGVNSLDDEIPDGIKFKRISVDVSYLDDYK